MAATVLVSPPCWLLLALMIYWSIHGYRTLISKLPTGYQEIFLNSSCRCISKDTGEIIAPSQVKHFDYRAGCIFGEILESERPQQNPVKYRFFVYDTSSEEYLESEKRDVIEELLLQRKVPIER